MNSYTVKYFKVKKTSATSDTKLLHSEILFFLIYSLKRRLISLSSFQILENLRQSKLNLLDHHLHFWFSKVYSFDMPNKYDPHNVNLGLYIHTYTSKVIADLEWQSEE